MTADVQTPMDTPVETPATVAPPVQKKRKRKDPAALPGQVSLFRGKVRAPVSITLTPAHHLKVNRNMRRLGLTRSDLLALLIEKHCDTVRIEER